MGNEKSDNYIDNAIALLESIRKTQADHIQQAVHQMYATFRAGNSIYVFGASHADIFTEEMYGRAGGLVIVNPIFNPTLMLDTRPLTVTTGMERLEGFGRVILENTAVRPGDTVIVHSVSGRNSVAIDLALAAKSRGAGIITVTSFETAGT